MVFSDIQDLNLFPIYLSLRCYWKICLTNIRRLTKKERHVIQESQVSCVQHTRQPVRQGSMWLQISAVSTTNILCPYTLCQPEDACVWALTQALICVLSGCLFSRPQESQVETTEKTLPVRPNFSSRPVSGPHYIRVRWVNCIKLSVFQEFFYRQRGKSLINLQEELKTRLWYRDSRFNVSDSLQQVMTIFLYAVRFVIATLVFKTKFYNIYIW